MELFIPSPNTTPDADSRQRDQEVWSWYKNVPTELKQNHLTQTEREAMRLYYQDAGLLRWWRLRYFQEHFSRTFAQASAFVLGPNPRPTILDLGCGTGTQTIFFALKGARVIAVDRDEGALEVLRKRAKLYAELAGRPLEIRTIGTDTLTFDYTSIAPLDGVYSMFAFNMMQPSQLLLDKLIPTFNCNGRIAILDGNHLAVWHRLAGTSRMEVLTPVDFDSALRNKGFRIYSHAGGIALPPLLWTVLPRQLARHINRFLNKTWCMPVSHQLLAERGGV